MIKNLVSKVFYYHVKDPQIIFWTELLCLRQLASCHATYWWFFIFHIQFQWSPILPIDVCWLWIGFPIQHKVLMFRTIIFMGSPIFFDELQRDMRKVDLDTSVRSKKCFGDPGGPSKKWFGAYQNFYHRFFLRAPARYSPTALSSCKSSIPFIAKVSRI